ncbi:Short integuments 2, mitochondrial [Asimina triloba]
MAAWAKSVGKKLGEMALNAGGGPINWFPGHMAAATRAIRQRLKLADLVIEVRDARIPLSSANEDLQQVISCKRRVIALNKKDLANPNIMQVLVTEVDTCFRFRLLLQRWIRHFDSCKQDCIPISAHSRSSVQKLLALVELKLKEVISREPTLLVMVVGVPNSRMTSQTSLIVQEKIKRATVGPLPGVTQDIAGYKIAHRPSIYVLDTPGVLVPSIPDIETGLKLALTGAVKDSVVGEERIAQYFLALLNTRSTPLHWRDFDNRRMEDSKCESKHENSDKFKDSLPRRRKPLNESDVRYIEDMVAEVKQTLYLTFAEFNGDVADESNLEGLIEQQFTGLQKAFRIPQKAGDDARTMVSKKLLTLFRIGKLGPFILDNVPNGRNLMP